MLYLIREHSDWSNKKEVEEHFNELFKLVKYFASIAATVKKRVKELIA